MAEKLAQLRDLNKAAQAEGKAVTGSYWVVVAAGGAVGALGRAAVTLWVGPMGYFPIATFPGQLNRLPRDRYGLGLFFAVNGSCFVTCFFDDRHARWLHHLFNFFPRDGAVDSARCLGMGGRLSGVEHALLCFGSRAGYLAAAISFVQI